MSLYEYRAKLVRVVDGDTLYLNVDLGLETSRILEVRLYGINCPEMHDVPAGQDAKNFTENWLAVHKDPDGWLTITTVKDRKEKYGRYLAIIHDGDGEGQVLNDDLVTSGHAQYKSY